MGEGYPLAIACRLPKSDAQGVVRWELRTDHMAPKL